MARTEIMDFFPRKLTPRDVQKNCLLELEKRWDDANVFVVNLPVAAGKSAISITLANWTKKASIITPNKLLVNQYKTEYKYLQVLRAKSDYWCSTFSCPISKRPQRKNMGKTCKASVGCEGCINYLSDLRKARVMPFLLSNYYIYMSHKLYRDTLIVDEAHSLIDTLKQMSAEVIWRFQHEYPSWVTTRDQLKDWVNSLPPEAFLKGGKCSGETNYGVKQDNLLFLKEELNSYRPRFLISITVDKYKGEEHECIKLIPLDIKDAPPIMWPSQVKKIVFLSATISRKDIEQLGLANKKIQYIQADSPIQAEYRPVVVPSEARSMAYAKQDLHMKQLVSFISNVANHHSGENGLIHCTYGLAEKLRVQQWDPEISSRLIFHSKKDKAKKYAEFRDQEEGKILIASGMYEGIDLPYNAGRWQVLAKVPWPSLADPAIKFLCSEDDEWYAWETIKTVLQACGRICRTPTDFGVSYLFDSTFERLYNKNIDLFPKWFRTSVQFQKERKNG